MKTFRKIFLLLVIVVLVGAIFAFSAQNSQDIDVGFFHWKTGPQPFALFMFVSFALGILLTGLFMTFGMIKLRAQLRKSRKAKEALEREIDMLRNQPLYEDGTPRPSEESTILDQER